MFFSGLGFNQATFLDFFPDVGEVRLTQLTATEYLIVGDVRKRKRWFRKPVKFFVSVKTERGQYQSAQSAEKHVDGKPSAGKLEGITVLTDFVGFKDREGFGLDRVEIDVGDYRVREVFRISRELLTELHHPFIGPGIAHLAYAQPRARQVVVRDLEMMIRARQSFGQVRQQIAPLALYACVLTVGDNGIQIC